MKYLVNRETKEHRLHNYGEEHRLGSVHGQWSVVEADDEGWIKWYGKSKKCPLPAKARVEVLFSYDNKAADHLLAGTWSWKDEELTHYRPILPAESKPTLEETWHKIKQEAQVDVFARLSAAVAASAEIPALISEINAMLPEGYEVREKAKPTPPIMSMQFQRDYISDYLNRPNPEPK